MSPWFDPQKGLVIVAARIDGPQGAEFIRLALDTGATTTILNEDVLVAAGYNPKKSKRRVGITTTSGIEYAAIVRLDKLSLLGQERRDFSVLAYTLPPSSRVDGLLGLDFLRGLALTIDFRSGQIRLT